MVRRIVAVVGVGVLSGCVSAPPKNDVQMPKAEWEYVCNALPEQGYDEVDCGLTPPPVVVISQIVPDSAGADEVLYGFTYPGEIYIYLNPDHPEMWNTIMVHEATHYLLAQTYGLDGMPDAVGRCESERVARVIHHAYEGTEYDGAWVLWYNCAEEVE